MLTQTTKLLLLIGLCAIAGHPQIILAQNSGAEFKKMLRERLSFDEANFAALEQGQTVVKLLPVQDKREVAVSGLVRLQVPAEVFLQSFRESMLRKSNPAILEIGGFSSQPTLADLNDLTFEDRDIEDLKECVVGDCKLKLSAMMIGRLHREVNWEAPDYRNQAAQLLKIMLLDYVRDYLKRGDTALIEYSDQAKTVRLAEEQRDLQASSNVLTRFSQYVSGFPEVKSAHLESVLVWSKMKFGLKPVIAINHIKIYQNENEAGPQILIASRQIYANHYFDSSLALSGFANIQGANPGSYLFYENRSRADGLGGVFSGIKRGIIEGKAVDSLKAIMEHSRVNLNARANRTEPLPRADTTRSWRRWTFGGVHLFLWLIVGLAFVSLLALRSYEWRRVVTREAHD